MLQLSIKKNISLFSHETTARYIFSDYYFMANFLIDSKIFLDWKLKKKLRFLWHSMEEKRNKDSLKLLNIYYQIYKSKVCWKLLYSLYTFYMYLCRVFQWYLCLNFPKPKLNKIKYFFCFSFGFLSSSLAHRKNNKCGKFSFVVYCLLKSNFEE